MNSVNSGAAAHTDDAVGASAEGKETSLPSASKKVKIFGGFSSARDVMNSGNACASASVASRGQKITAAAPFKTKVSAKSNDNEFSIDLLVRGLNYHKENLSSLESISLHREPMNVFDPNAIAAHNDKGGVVGHVAREQAVRTLLWLLRGKLPVALSNVYSLHCTRLNWHPFWMSVQLYFRISS